MSNDDQYDRKNAEDHVHLANALANERGEPLRRSAPDAPPARLTGDADLLKQINGYSLTTAEITYRMPDARTVLQTFLWQEYDLAPRFPKLEGFLDFWERELDGPIHSVRIASAQLLRPLELRAATDLTIH